jgi:hypothetical protein
VSLRKVDGRNQDMQDAQNPKRTYMGNREEQKASRLVPPPRHAYFQNGNNHGGEGVNIFWIVWNPHGSNPTHQHVNRELAQKEASRLALAHPGIEFIVLQAIGKAVKRDVDWIEVSGDELPF